MCLSAGTVSKVLIGGALGAVSAVVFLSPLLIRSPCLTDELPPKPALVGHRGAPLVSAVFSEPALQSPRILHLDPVLTDSASTELCTNVSY